MEFALVAPLLLLFIFGIIEAGRALWCLQVVQESAYATARCVAIGDPSCSDDDAAKQFAVTHVARSGLTLPLAGVTIEKNVTCDGIGDMARVSLALPFQMTVGRLIPAMPTSLNSAACMPAVSTP